MSAIDKQQVAEWLASFEDEDERNRALRGARMLAANLASPEALAAKPLIRTLGDYLAAEIEVPPVLIHPFVAVRGGVNVTVGRAGKGKTVMNLNRMLRWSAGLPWFETLVDAEDNKVLAPDMPLKILIVENEGAPGLFHRQIGIMLHAEDYLDQEARATAKENTLIWKDGGYSGLKLDDEEKLEELRSGVNEWRPDIVFIEPFRSLWAGEENSSTEMSTVLDALGAIAADFNCAVWAAHHEKKGGAGEDDKMSAARGSTVLEGFVTTMEHFESTKGGEQREVSYPKLRHGRAPNPVRLEWDDQAWWYKHVESDMIEEEILDALRLQADGEPMNVRDLSEATDESQSKVREVCKRMAKDGRIKALSSIATQNGSTGARYRLPSDESTSTGGLPI